MNEIVNEQQGSTTDTNVSGLATHAADSKLSGLSSHVADSKLSGLAPLGADSQSVTDRAAHGPYRDEVRGAVSGRRRQGKVARLPKAIREQINEWIEEGITYAEIVERLRTEEEVEVSISNVSQWEKGGYRDWLKERERTALLEGNFSRVVDLLAKAEPDEVPDLIVKLFAARVGGVLSELTPGELRENSEKDPRNLIRLLSLVPKLSREALRTRKYRRAVEREEAAELQERDPNKPFGDQDDHRAVVDVVDKVLGLGRYTKPRGKMQTSDIEPGEERNRKPNPNVGLAENGKGAEAEGDGEGVQPQIGNLKTARPAVGPYLERKL